MIKRLLAAAAFAALISGCMQDGGTEIPNELVGHEFIAGKGAAAGAEIKLIPVGYLPGSALGPDSANPVILATKTDAAGRFAFRGVPPGQYNLLAAQDGLHSFRDSVPISGAGQDLNADTLHTPAILTGRVELEPQDDPQSATVQALGTTEFVNVDADGFFQFKALGAGQYRLRASTILPLYTSDYQVVSVRAGANDTLRQPLRPYYSGIPVVRGLTVTPNADGALVLKWNKPAFKKVLAYLIYRDAAGVLLPSTMPIRRVTDTTFSDTIYSQTPDSNQFPYQDTVPHSYSYRVKILDWSANVGPSYGLTEATAIPPTLMANSGKWKRLSNRVPTLDHGGELIVFRDSLWIFGPPDSGRTPGGSNTIMISGDGVTWARKLQVDTLPMWAEKVVAFHDSLWAVGARAQPAAGDSSTFANTLWASADGARWKEVVAALPFDYRWSFGMLVWKDSLWILSGQTYQGPGGFPDPWHSGDGRTWLRGEATPGQWFSGTEFAGFQDKLFAIGGGNFNGSVPHGQILSSPDGNAFTGSEAPVGLLPRSNHAVAVHGGKLWVIGGGPEMSYYPRHPLSDVWSSPDGAHWTLVDGHAPFQGRSHAGAVSFRGKLYVMGGNLEVGAATDIWYMDP